MTDHAPPDTGTGHGGHQPVDDRTIPWRVFGAVSAIILVLGLIYWATAYEESGTVMLMVAAGLTLWVAVFLWRHERSLTTEPPPAPAATGAAAAAAAEEAEYLPHASIWPFAIGLGATLVGVGMAIGLWVLVPGLGIMALGIGGFVRQTRRRD